MNWLAHLFLSEHNTDYQLGNLLADPLKGKAWPGASEKLQQGMQTHRRIDAFTDQHPQVQQSKQRLGRAGYLRGVVIDIVYDHLLTQHWQQFATVEQPAFIDEFYSRATQIKNTLPTEASVFIESLMRSERLKKYTTLDELADAFIRTDKRLSARLKKKETTIQYLPIIEKQLAHIEKDFLTFFPLLQTHLQPYIHNSHTPHWRSPIPSQIIP